MNQTQGGGLKKLLREPLLHFLLIGAALFLLFELGQEPGGDTARQIVVETGQVEQLTARFKRTFFRWPTPEERTAIIEGYIRDEVYYREALAMGLDRDDPQVRKRMRLKLEFLLEDLTAEAPPSDEVLSAYLAEHGQKFQEEPQVSILQLYLNPENHRDLDAVASQMLARLVSSADTSRMGDPTMVPHRFTLASQGEIARFFGDSFAKRIVEVESGDWTGPLASELGVHLVLVTKRIEARMPELAEVRPQVVREYLAELRKQLKDETYAQLLKGYEVIIAPPTASDERVGNVIAGTPSEEESR